MGLSLGLSIDPAIVQQGTPQAFTVERDAVRRSANVLGNDQTPSTKRAGSRPARLAVWAKNQRGEVVTSGAAAV